MDAGNNSTTITRKCFMPIIINWRFIPMHSLRHAFPLLTIFDLFPMLLHICKSRFFFSNQKWVCFAQFLIAAVIVMKRDVFPCLITMILLMLPLWQTHFFFEIIFPLTLRKDECLRRKGSGGPPIARFPPILPLQPRPNFVTNAQI